MIIDSHVHIGQSEKNSRSFTFDSYNLFMKKCGVDKSIVMPNVSNILSSSELNRKFIANYISYPVKNVFYPLLFIDPYDLYIEDQIGLLRHMIYGVKYHPSICEMPISYKRMYPLIEMVDELKLPVLVHCGRHWRSRIQFIMKVAKKFKNTKFIAAHLGGNATDVIEKSLRALKVLKPDNIYLDTSAGKLPWLIEKAINIMGEDRILFGSDEPYADLRIGIQCVDLCRFSDDIKEKIFYKNVENIYN